MTTINKIELESAHMDVPRHYVEFEALCRELRIWGTPHAELCAVFWREAYKAGRESMRADVIAAAYGGMGTELSIKENNHCIDITVGIK